MSKRTATDDALEARIAPMCDALGVELVDARLVREPGGSVIRVVLDRARGDEKDGSGVDLGDCTEIHRQIARLIEDEPDFVGDPRIEVGSPGLDRPLTKPAHFQRFRGHEVKLKAQPPIDGRRNFQGLLRECDEQTIRIEIDDTIFEVPFASITKANLVPRF